MSAQTAGLSISTGTTNPPTSGTVSGRPSIRRASSLLGFSLDSLKDGSSDRESKNTNMRRKASILRANVNFVRLKATIDAVKHNSDEVDSVDDLRVQLKKYLSNSLAGKVYENFIIFVSILSAGAYIHETYAGDEHNLYWHHMNTLNYLGLICASIFIFDWILNFFLADNKFYYFWR
jgi:hypothetical protein